MKASLLALCCLLLSPRVHAGQTIAIDPSKTKAPISPYLYGQFIEHLGRCVNGGLWAEMLEDRKFFYPVTDSHNPWALATDPLRNAGPYKYLNASPWREIAPNAASGTVTMDAEQPSAGAHAPVVHLPGGGREAGVGQDGLEVGQGRGYSGRIVLRGDASAAPVFVRLAVKGGPAVSKRIGRLSGLYRPYAFKFGALSASGPASLEIVSRGTGTFEIGAVSLMPADNIHGWRADTVALLKQLDAPIYRWPGGNFVSGYDWKDGVGPDRDKRPPRKNPAWKGIEPNDVGIHEYMDLMRLIGAEPYIAVNTGLGSVESAREEVEYCNGPAGSPMGRRRAADGHPAPFGVKWWAVGNEMYGDWELGNMPLSQYMRKHVETARAMRGADPSAQLVAVGDVETQGWNAAMLEAASGDMNLISEHVYEHEKADVPAHIAQLAEAIRKVAETHRGPAGKGVRVALDEWNYWYGDYLYGELGVRYHLKDALGVAKALHELFRNSDIFAMANYAQTVNVIGAIKTTPQAAAFDATAVPLALYRRRFGAVPIDVAQPGGGLDVAAAWTADKKAITIAVVNPRPDADDLTVSLGATAVKDRVKQWLITGDGPESYNEPGKAPAIAVREGEVSFARRVLPVPGLSVAVYRLDLR